MGSADSTHLSMRLRSVIWPAVVAGGTMLGAAVIVTSHDSERRAVAQRARLLLIWDDMAHLPANDRALLQALAERCHLADEPMEYWPAVDCLERAAAHTGRALQGVDAEAELRRLLDDRARPAPAQRRQVQPLT